MTQQRWANENWGEENPEMPKARFRSEGTVANSAKNGE